MDVLLQDVLFCDDCAHLNLTEEQQEVLKRQRRYRDHICLLYNQRLVHLSKHPHICRLKGCIGYNAKVPTVMEEKL